MIGIFSLSELFNLAALFESLDLFCFLILTKNDHCVRRVVCPDWVETMHRQLSPL